MRESIGRIVGALVGFVLSLLPVWAGLTEAMSADLQMSITAALVALGYGITHKFLRSNVSAFNDD